MKKIILLLVLFISGYDLVMAAYQDDIDALLPTHYWTFNNTLNDRGNGVLTNGVFESGAAYGTPITAGSTNALQSNTGQVTAGNTNDTNDGTNLYQTRTFSTWFQANDLSNPTIVWEEGGNVNNFAISVGVARNIQFQAADAGCYYLTKFSDTIIEQGKPYLITATWERGSSSPTGKTRVRIWLNGVEQSPNVEIESSCNDVFPSHGGDINFGNTNESLKFYNEATMNYVDLNKKLAHFAIWNDYILTSTEIDTLFENGASQINSNLLIKNIPAQTSVSLHEIDALGGSLVSSTQSQILYGGVDLNLSYPVTTAVPSRVRLITYGKKTYEGDQLLSRFPNESPFFLIDDNHTTEPLEANTRNYTIINDTNNLYDFSRLYDIDHPSNGFDILKVDGSTLNFGNFNVIFDSAASNVFAFNGTDTVTIKTNNLSCSGTKFDKIITTGLISFAGTANAGSCVTEDVNGSSSVLRLNNVPTGATVYVQDDAGVQQDYVTSFSGGMYGFNINNSATGTWTYVVKEPGYDAIVSTFVPTGGFFEFAIASTQQKQPNGTLMYNGSSSAFVDIEFIGTTQLNIDIADALVASQVVYDEVEQALITAAGMKWLADGKSGVAIANLSAGNFVFMNDDIRFRRNIAGDVNATVNAFSISTQGVVTDGTNGSVAFLSSSSTADIADAVWDKLLVDHEIDGTFGKFLQDMAGDGFDATKHALSKQSQNLLDIGILNFNTMKDLLD